MALLHITPENYEKEITKSELPTLMDFWAPWCSPCLMMAPVFEELSSEYEGKVKFVKVNTEDHPELAMPFGIQGIPTLILAKDGKEVDRLVGFAPKEYLKSKIDEMVAKLN
jgi:thioredoxin 1